MKKYLFLFTLTFVLFTFSFAQKGTIELPATGQSTSYHAGDDGDLQEGVPISENRFTNHDDGSATDQFTGLMWVTDANLIASRDPDFDQDRTPGDGDINWITALNYIEKLNTENYLGYNDWRMPNYLELRSLVNLGNDSIAFPANHPFTNLKEGYWSSTTPDGRRSAAISVFLSKFYVHIYLSYAVGDFVDMNKNLDLSTNDYYKLYLLPVRDGTETGEIKIPRSGQKLTFYAGDDAAIDVGTKWPSPRLIDNNDGSVSDKLTGLMWTKETMPMYNRDPDYYEENGSGWVSSLDYVAKLNNENYLGYNDWRMPNRNELTSLIDCSQNSQNLPKNNPFISTWPYEYPSQYPMLRYWTSSTLASDENMAWDYTFELNSGSYTDKSIEKHVWPVRTNNSNVSSGSINGMIEGTGLPKEEMEIHFEGPVNAYAEVGADGQYSFTGLAEGSYTVTPSHSYMAFTPQSKSVVVSNSSETCNFTASYIQTYGWVDISSNLFPLENAAGAGLSDVYFINEYEGWITCSSNFEIYHTTDGGETFEVQTTPLGKSLEAIYMIDENEGYAGGASGFIYRTIDGGDNWIFHGTISSTLTDIDFATPTQGYCSGFSGAVFSITPEGVTNLNSGLASNLGAVGSPSVNKVWVTGTGNISFYDGANWIFQSGPAGSYNALCFINDNEGWVVGDAGLIGGTNDGGNAWKSLAPLNSESLFGVHSPNGVDVWTVGAQGTILHSPNGDDFWWNSSEDQGMNVAWNIEGAGLTDALLRSVIFPSINIGYVSGNNGVLLKYGNLTGIADEWAEVKSNIYLKQIAPNPFYEHTSISYELPGNELVNIIVCDMTGKKVKQLLNKSQNKGEYSVEFDAQDLPNGIYFCCLTTKHSTETMKMVKIK